MSIYRDPLTITKYLTKWLKDHFEAAGSNGAVLGISGGIDSAVLTGLLVKALGKENEIGRAHV